MRGRGCLDFPYCEHPQTHFFMSANNNNNIFNYCGKRSHNILFYSLNLYSQIRFKEQKRKMNGRRWGGRGSVFVVVIKV